jgi:transcriptional regulator
LSIKNDLEIQEIQALKGLIEKELRDNVELTGRSICFWKTINSKLELLARIRAKAVQEEMQIFVDHS